MKLEAEVITVNDIEIMNFGNGKIFSFDDKEVMRLYTENEWQGMLNGGEKLEVQSRDYPFEKYTSDPLVGAGELSLLSNPYKNNAGSPIFPEYLENGILGTKITDGNKVITLGEIDSEGNIPLLISKLGSNREPDGQYEFNPQANIINEVPLGTDYEMSFGLTKINDNMISLEDIKHATVGENIISGRYDVLTVAEIKENGDITLLLSQPNSYQAEYDHPSKFLKQYEFSPQTNTINEVSLGVEYQVAFIADPSTWYDNDEIYVFNKDLKNTEIGHIWGDDLSRKSLDRIEYNCESVTLIGREGDNATVVKTFISVGEEGEATVQQWQQYEVNLKTGEKKEVEVSPEYSLDNTLPILSVQALRTEKDKQGKDWYPYDELPIYAADLENAEIGKVWEQKGDGTGVQSKLEVTDKEGSLVTLKLTESNIMGRSHEGVSERINTDVLTFDCNTKTLTTLAHEQSHNKISEISHDVDGASLETTTKPLEKQAARG